MTNTIGGRYELKEPLGRGGMGEVYEGRDTQLGRAVALKRIDAAGDLAQLARGEGERMARVADKRHVVEVFDVVQEDGELWMVMELVPGGRTLADLVGDAPAGGADAPTVDAVRAMLIEALTGLAAIHASGVSHGDLKGTNLMVGADGHLKIADFGIAQLEGDAQRTQAFGTARTTAPEVFEGDLGPAADVYALGHTFYELLAGADAYGRAFAGPLRAEVAAAAWTRWHLDPTLAPPGLDEVADVPADLAQLVARMMEKDPARRIQVGDALAWLGVEAAPPASGAGRGRRDGTEALGAHASGGAAPAAGAEGRRGLRPFAFAGVGLLLLLGAAAALKGGGGEEHGAAPGLAEGEARVELPAPTGPTKLETTLVRHLDEPLVTREESLQVTGRVLNPRAPHVTVAVLEREVDVPIDEEGRFAGRAPLPKDRTSTVRVAALGLEGALEIQVVQDSSPPLVEVVEPDAEAVVAGESVPVAVRAVDPHLARVRAAGAPLEASEDGLWRGEVSLRVEGVQRIQVEAWDALGHRASVEHSVRRDTAGPALVDAAPGAEALLEAGTPASFSLAFDEPVASVTVDATTLAVEGSAATGDVPVPDADGHHRFAWSAEDALGNRSEGSLRVALDSRWGDVPRERRADFALEERTLVRDGGRRFPAALRHVPTGVVFVYVPSGSFELGAAEAGLESQNYGWYGMTRREVAISGFYLARVETTRGQFTGAGDDPAPMTDVSWSAAASWCQGHGFRLPSEAEFEYAASGPDDRRYPWGDDYLPDRLPLGALAEAGEHADGASWCGALDLSGNVWEWTRDPWRDSYAWITPGASDPVAEGDERARTVRGGGFSDRRPELTSRTWFRRARRPDAAGEELGFRAALRF